jgi:hypothetical protein
MPLAGNPTITGTEPQRTGVVIPNSSKTVPMDNTVRVNPVSPRTLVPMDNTGERETHANQLAIVQRDAPTFMDKSSPSGGIVAQMDNTLDVTMDRRGHRDTTRAAQITTLQNSAADKRRRVTWSDPLTYHHKPPHGISDNLSGLDPPLLENGHQASGFTTPRLRIENKRRRILRQREQAQPPTLWIAHMGETTPSVPTMPRPLYRNNMCP